MSNFLVCIRSYTYNQSSYIEKTLDSLVIQETTFPYIILLVDDASTDGEQTIIRNYITKNFDVDNKSISYTEETDYADITFARHRTNENCYIASLCLKYNHHSINKPKINYLYKWRSMCKYEAICEGDDYWIDSSKLQSQVDMMEQCDDMALCYTRTRYWYEDNKAFLYDWGGSNTSFKDLLILNTIPTLTVLYRVDYMFKYFDEIAPQSRTWLMGDYPMWLWFAYNYKVAFIDKVTSVYRVLNESASHSKDVEKKLGFILSSIDIQEFFANRYGVKTGVDYAKLRIQAKMYNYALYGKRKLFADNWKKLLEYSKWNLLCLFPYKYMLFFIFPRLRKKYLIH